MNRISVTTLEAFRRFIQHVSDYDTEEKLIQSITGEFVGNAKTFYGTGFHSIVEGEFQHFKKTNVVAANSGVYGNIYVDLKDKIIASDIAFTMKQAAPALQYAKDHSLMVHEVNLAQNYETKHGPIQVGGRVDGLEGNVIRDIKTKYRTPKADEYIASCQWKFYLDIMNLNQFYFDVFEVKNFTDFDITELTDKDLENRKPVIVEDAVIVPYPEIECLSYLHMHDDCLSILNEFLDWINFRDMWGYLKPAKEQELFQ